MLLKHYMNVRIRIQTSFIEKELRRRSRKPKLKKILQNSKLSDHAYNKDVALRTRYIK